MGFDDGQIILENAASGEAFYAGQTIQGRMMFRQNKVKTFRGFYVKLKGECNIHWTSRHSRKNSQGKTEHYTVNHNSHEEYVNIKLYLMGGPSGEVHLNPGDHVFPFQLQIPANCPSSYESRNGNIRYKLKFVIDRAFKFDQEKELSIRVLSSRDLNSDPYCREPIAMDFEQTYCCWCMSSGIFTMEARVPQSGYCPGQTLRCDVKCNNRSTVSVDSIKFEIIEKRHYIAESHPDTRTDRHVVAKIKKGPVPGNTSRTWTVELEIPQMDVYNLDACSFIDVYYEFKVKVCPSGCHQDDSHIRRIVIGDIPLHEFENDTPVQNEIAGPMTHGPIETQPGQPYPSAYPPHPSANPDYPGSNPPYPGANPDYPGANPAYPGANPDYPGANTPYPGANPPYPGANPPYPGANTPYPGANPDYPGAIPPYPGTSPPYPAANPPYPSTNTFHPGPYPGKPTVTGQTPPPPYPGQGIKFPSPGFVVPTTEENRDGSNLPLLPGPIPYVPVPTPMSPYAKASAPEPSTPDTATELPRPPPFNPEHKENDQHK